MKRYVLIIGLLSLFYSCQWDWDITIENRYFFKLLSADSMQVLNLPVKSIDPIEKNMESILLFDAYQNYTTYVIQQSTRSDTFKIIYDMKVVDNNVQFSNFKFSSNTIHQAEISEDGFYSDDFPFIKLFLTK